MADGSSAAHVSVQWRAWDISSGRYEVRHYTGNKCERCVGTGTDVNYLLVPFVCGGCSGTGKEINWACRCELCEAGREALR